MQQRGARWAVVGALVSVAIVPILAGRAGASHEEWGFSYLSHTSAPPGTEIDGGMKRQISHDVPYAGDAFEPQPIRLGDEMCDDAGGRLLDSSGRVIASEEIVTRHDDTFGDYPTIQHIIIPDGTAPGIYYLQESCVYGAGEPDPSGAGRDFGDPIYELPAGLHTESDCVRFEVTAPSTAPGPRYFVYRGGGPLLRDRCPISLWAVLDRGAGGLGIGLRDLFDLFGARVVPPVVTTTTSAPTSPTTPTTAPKGPPPDTSAPVMTGLTITDRCLNNLPPLLQATAADNVGVVSVTFAWSYAAPGGASGSGMMSGGPTSFSATVPMSGFPPNGKKLTVTAIAHDLAGNASSTRTTSQQITC